MDDKFFVDLLDEGSEKLLGQYAIFLKCEGMAVGSGTHVAQCRVTLIFQIKNILYLVSVLRHLRFTKEITPLLLERDLLSLELTIMNNAWRAGSGVRKGEYHPAPPGPMPAISARIDGLGNLGRTHKQIAEFIASHDRVQNLDIFKKFSGIARRTLKRKLSELIGAEVIKRFTEGKRVFYSPRT